MAKYRTEEVVRGLEVAFPTDCFVVRITELKRKRSSNGNLMVECDIEIMSPKTVDTPSGVTVQTAGLKARMWNLLDPSETYGLSKLVSALKRGGLDPVEVQGLEEGELFSDEPADLAKFVGKCVNMTLSCEQKPVMRNPTPEQAAAGVKREQLLDKNGKPMYNGYQIIADFGNITGPASDDGNNPF